MGRPKGFKQTEEFKALLRQKFSGEGNPFYGKEHSATTKKKMSDNHADFSGDKNPFKNSLAKPENSTRHKQRCQATWDNRDEEYRKEFGRKTWTGHGEIHGTFWGRVHSNAALRKLKVEVSIEQAWHLFQKQKGKCALSGLPLKFGATMKQETTASLDRIDSTKHYTLDNIQWVHKTINLMKKSMNEKDFIGFCKAVGKHARLK
jgi:hypothetical protein